MGTTALWGAAATISASFVWAIAVVLFEKYGDSYSPLFINFIKTVTALSFIVLVVFVFEISITFDVNFILWMSVSGITGLAVGDCAMIASIQRLGAFASSILMLLIAPFATLFGYLFLGETLLPRQFLGMSVTIVAVGCALAVNRSGSGFFSEIKRSDLKFGLIAAFTAILAAALSTIAARSVMQDQNIWVGTMVRVLACLIVLLPFFLRNILVNRSSKKKRPDASLGWIVLASFLGGALGLVLLTIGYKFLKAGVSTSLASMVPLWVIPLSALMLGEKVKLRTILLTLVAFLGIFLIF